MLKTQPKPPPTPGSLIKNSKLRGEWAELRFMTRAAERGLMISKPWGDSARYDLMIEHHGRVLRIQVKSTMRIVRGCYRGHLPTLSRFHPEARALTKNCHPEATAFSSPKDPGAPREASRTLRGNNSRVRRASKSEAQLRTLPGSLAPAAVDLLKPVIPTEAKRERAQWRDLAFSRYTEM